MKRKREEEREGNTQQVSKMTINARGHALKCLFKRNQVPQRQVCGLPLIEISDNQNI